MPRAPSSTKGRGPQGGAGPSKGGMRHDPLGLQLDQDEKVSRFGNVSAPGRRNKKAHRRQGDDDVGDNDDDTSIVGTPQGSSLKVTGGRALAVPDAMERTTQFVDPKLSRNILRLAREQQEEIEQEEAAGNDLPNGNVRGSRGLARDAQMSLEDSDEDDIADGGAAAGSDDGDLDSADEEGGSVPEEYEELDIDPDDAALMERFGAAGDEVGSGQQGGRNGNKTLADMIMEKIEAAERQAANGNIHEKAPRGTGDGMPMPPGLNPKVIEVYTKVGELLSRYKSGPLPKAFKIIPTLPAWENILYITGPTTWTPHATLAATRIFVSNLKSNQTQKFFELVLLDKIREEIAETGKASYQLYEAMKKALFKPAAFFKGILFPLCETGCTLKEAAIVSSVLTRVSIPILHSAAALLRLAEMHYAGPTSLFIRVLLDKKYALPYKVVDALVFHFLRFADPEMGVERIKESSDDNNNNKATDSNGTGRRMPVLWHQSLLVFCQRYKQDLTPDQKAALLDLLRVQTHVGISPEVRRELVNSKARGEMLDEPIDEDEDEDDLMSV